MPQTTEPITVSVKKAGEILGLSTWQVKQRCDAGLIKSVFERGPKGRRLVFIESIDAYLASLPSERPSDGAA